MWLHPTHMLVGGHFTERVNSTSLSLVEKCLCFSGRKKNLKWNSLGNTQTIEKLFKLCKLLHVEMMEQPIMQLLLLGISGQGFTLSSLLP